MSTYQSINLHPDLKRRLVTPEGRPLESPMALLSKPCHTIRFLKEEKGKEPKIIMAPTKILEELRTDVAMALVQQRTRYKGVHDSNQQNNPLPGATPLDQLIQQSIDNFKTFYSLSLSTGSSNLDKLLSQPLPPLDPSQLHMDEPDRSSGVVFGSVLQICGPPASGKTQIALTLTTCPLLQECHYLTYLPQATLSRRIASMVPGHDSLETVTRRTHMHSVQDALSLLRALQLLDVDLATRQSTVGVPRLLVVDTISFLLGSCIADDWKDEIAWTLRKLARQYCMAVVVLNGTVANGEKAALGRFAERLGDSQVFLRDGTATLLRHPENDRVGSAMTLGTQRGIGDVSFEWVDKDQL